MAYTDRLRQLENDTVMACEAFVAGHAQRGCDNCGQSKSDHDIKWLLKQIDHGGGAVVIHNHYHSGDGANRKLDDILARLKGIQQQETDQMKTVEQFKAEMEAANTALSAEVAENQDLEQSIKTALDGQTAQLAALRKQIEDLIAGGGDATALQPVLDALNAQIALQTATNDKLRADILANTPPPA